VRTAPPVGSALAPPSIAFPRLFVQSFIHHISQLTAKLTAIAFVTNILSRSPSLFLKNKPFDRVRLKQKMLIVNVSHP
jgi:hypothetical protein